MTIKLNGQPHQTVSTSIEELLNELNMPRIGIAVARNGAVVRKHEIKDTGLQEGDEIEVIRAVQGG